MKNAFVLLRSKGVKVVAAVSASMVAASSAHADIAADIAAAQTSGISNVTLAVGAVIAVAAIVLGVGIVLSLMKR
jgi:hypothetical protein